MINLLISYQKSVITLLIVTIANCSAAQLNSYKNELSPEFHKRDTIKEKLDRSDFSIDLSVSSVPPAKITRNQGTYRLQSRLQSAYDLGFNYVYNVNRNISLITGIGATVGTWGFYLNIPDEDVSAYNVSGSLIVWHKNVWSQLKIPLLIEKKLDSRKFGLMSAKAGINLRHSVFNPDLVVAGGGIITSNNQVIEIFDSDFSLNNQNKPWVTFLLGIHKWVYLKNYNTLALGLIADVSTTKFLKGNYQITVPNMPVTTGAYSMKGSSLAFSVEYVFTGYNRRYIRKL